MFATLPVNFLLYTAASITEYETISFDGEKVNKAILDGGSSAVAAHCSTVVL